MAITYFAAFASVHPACYTSHEAMPIQSTQSVGRCNSFEVIQFSIFA
jgi:hypothetical protein